MKLTLCLFSRYVYKLSIFIVITTYVHAYIATASFNCNSFGCLSYTIERQHSTKFHQNVQAKPNVPNNTSEPYRQMGVSRNMPPLEVGDAVQSGSNPISYETIKWIGEFSGFHEKIAGIEMVKKLCTTSLS